MAATAAIHPSSSLPAPGQTSGAASPESPLYRQIASVLEKEIRQQCHPGDRLSEQALSGRFGVNRHTLRRAVDVLVLAGLVKRQRGSGVHILPGAIDYKIGPATRFNVMIEESGHHPETRLIAKSIFSAEPLIAKQLRLKAAASVVVVEALRIVDGRPFCVQSQYFSQRDFPCIKNSYEGGSMHAFLYDHTGVTLRRTSSAISTTLPDEQDALLLHIGPSQPVLQVRSLNVNAATQRPLEYCVTRFRGDRLELTVQFPGTA